jgi:hypothetical protein
MQRHRFRIFLALAIPLLLTASACEKGTDSNQAAANRSNAGTDDSKSSIPATANASPGGEAKKIAFGTLEITSKPPGARVLLIATDEGGASEPQPRGVTPTTITHLSPGKYTVDLELTGYKYFQKKVEVKEDQTVKVTAVLSKG